MVVPQPGGVYRDAALTCAIWRKCSAMNGFRSLVESSFMKNLRIAILASAAVLATPAYAQDIVAVDDGENQAEIVVVATGFAQPRDTTGQAITVVTAADLERLQTVNLSDALRTLPGTSIAQRGSVGGQTSVFLRGGESSQTLVLIDGVRINDPSSPNAAVDFGSLLAGNSGRIEVLRGPNSIVWGSQAIGGVVNIESALPTAGLNARGAVEYGYADSVLARANVAGGSDAVQASVGGSFYRTDGISSLAGGAGAEKDGSRSWALNGRVKVRIASNVSLDLRAYYNEGRIEFDDPWAATPAEALPVANNRQFAGYAGVNFTLADGKWQNRIGYTRTDIRRRGTDPVIYSYNNYVVSGEIDRFEYRGSYDLAAIATLGFGLEHERTSSSTSYEGEPAQLLDTTVTSGYAQLSLRPVDDLTLTGGVRHDDYSAYGGQTTLGGNFAWTLNGGATVLRATFAEGFRAPTLTEGQPPNGNPDIKPETARNIDLGIEQALLNDQVQVDLTWFNRRSTNLITYLNGRSQNVGKVDAEGVEFALRLRPTARLVVEGNYTLTNAFNQSGELIGKRLQLRPQHSGSLSLDWDSPLGLRLGGTVLFAGDSFGDDKNLISLDGYALFNLRAALPLNDRLELYGRIENLTNAQYQTVVGYGTYGRAAYAGVRAKW